MGTGHNTAKDGDPGIADRKPGIECFSEDPTRTNDEAKEDLS